MATKEKNSNQYADIDDMTSAYDDRFLIRVSTNADDEPDPPIAAPETDKVVQALRKVSDLIDSYIMGLVVTPVDCPPDYFVTKTVRMAAAELVRWKGYEPDTPDALIVKEGKECEKFWEQVAAGKIKLSLPDSGGTTAPQTRVVSSAPRKRYTEATLDQYTA